MPSENPKIVVVGLGYVGLPLAVALAGRFDVVGLDVDQTRVAELRRGHDRTKELSSEVLSRSSLSLTTEPQECRGHDVYIVTVPTPVDAENLPDLGAVTAATKSVAGMLDAAAKPIVVYESTVYPGVTEGVCGPLLEEHSGLQRGRDFFLGYSPERINPGDREHSVDQIVKVISGENAEVLQRLDEIYGSMTTAGTFRAASIQVAEAAKVIENAQRDINIAFMNEITRIFEKLDISIWDVLEAAKTKWNFLPFQPGLVGGHCIGVDPYYLCHRALLLGQVPQVILAGRSINDSMGAWIARRLHERCGKPGRALIMGLTFKENVPDLRNSRVIDVISTLQDLGHDVIVHDPLADPIEAEHELGITLDRDALAGSYDLALVAVAHAQYRDLADAELSALVAPGGLFADLKNLYSKRELPGIKRRWTL